MKTQARVLAHLDILCSAHTGFLPSGKKQMWWRRGDQSKVLLCVAKSQKVPLLLT